MNDMLRTMRIIRSAQKLDLNYVPSRILCRDKEIKRLRIAIESGGRAIICGETGTGKTMLAKYFARDAAYINCFINRTEHAILETILGILRPRFNPAGLSSRRLWNEIPPDSFIILDEVEGISIDDLPHFLYTLSRRAETGKRIKYIAITRDADILKQMVGDAAVWSTFAGKSIIHLERYGKEEMVEILSYRASEALYDGSISEDVISLIADIALRSEGHMRTGIELLRNSAMIAESEGRDHIEPEDVREANMDVWLDEMEIMDEEHLIMLLAVSLCCKERAYATIDDIKSTYIRVCENYGSKPGDIDKLLRKLEMHGFVMKVDGTYTIPFPTSKIIQKIEKSIEKSGELNSFIS